MFKILSCQGNANYLTRQSEWPKINKTNYSSCWRGCGTKKTLLHCWGEYSVRNHYGNRCGGSLGRQLIFLKVQLCRPWPYTQRMFHPTTETLAQPLFCSRESELTVTQVSANAEKENVLHLHQGIYSIIKESEVMKLAGKWVELEKNIILSEIAQTSMCSRIGGCQLLNQR